MEALEPYILSDQLADMSPSISQCLLSHQEVSGRLQATEACIVHLHVTSLDLHQAMTLCWTHGLYDAIFYIYTRGMRDFVSPLEELVTVLRNAMDSGNALTVTQVTYSLYCMFLSVMVKKVPVYQSGQGYGWKGHI